MMHRNLSVVTILVLLKFIHCSVPEARVKCEENAKNYNFSLSSKFEYRILPFSKSPTDDTIFCNVVERNQVFDLEFVVYLKLPILEVCPYISTMNSGTNGTCLETRKVSITKTFRRSNREFKKIGIEFVSMIYQFETNARFDFAGPHSEDCDWRKSSSKLPCHMGFLLEKRWYYQFEVEKNQTWMGHLIPENATISSLTIRSSLTNLDIVNSLNFWLGNLTNGIKILNMSNCSLKQNANISSMPELTELDLSDSGISNIFLDDYPKKFPKLQVLNLAGNFQITIGNTLKNMSKLLELDISYTILDLNPGALKLPSTVTILRAMKLYCTADNYNRIFDWYTEKYPNQKCNDEANVLILSMLRQFSNLQTVIFSDNDFKKISSDSFINLARNATVDLTNNKISEVNSLHLKSIYLIDLTKNNISNLDNMIMAGFIDNLNLSYNKISNWKLKDVFNSDSLQIKFVNLSYNEINSFNSEMLKSLSSLEAVDIGNNPIDCRDCSIKDLQTWLKDPRRKTMVTNLGEPYTSLKCTYPPLLSNTSILNAPYNNLCGESTNLIIGFSIPIALLLLIISLLTYVYRFQLSYVAHMVQVRKRAKTQNIDQQKKFEYDAFVSYSSADRSWVFEKLMKTLESEDYKYTLCLHERDFRLGKYIMDNVADSIEKSRHVIVVLSPNFVSSQWCQWELKLVQQFIFENNPEFLVLIELQRLSKKDLPSTLRLLMCTRTYLECPEEGSDMSSFWRRLTKILGEPIVQPCNVETECSENIIEQMMELYQQEVNEILTSPESLLSDTESTL